MHRIPTSRPVEGDQRPLVPTPTFFGNLVSLETTALRHQDATERDGGVHLQKRYLITFFFLTASTRGRLVPSGDQPPSPIFHTSDDGLRQGSLLLPPPPPKKKAHSRHSSSSGFSHSFSLHQNDKTTLPVHTTRPATFFPGREATCKLF